MEQPHRSGVQPEQPRRSETPPDPEQPGRPDQEQPRRSDAQRNRERILAVAYDLLTADGTTSLNAIAKAAGVGPGTLYRHFPTREALLLAVYRHEVRQLVDAAPALLDRHPPLAALREWLDRLAGYGATKVGLAEAIAGSRDQLNAENYGPVIGALTALLRANEQAGTIRSGVDPDDFLLLLGFLWRIDPATDWRARSQRILDLVLTGLLPR